MFLRVGDRVQVRDSDEEPWRTATVMELVGLKGNPRVQLDYVYKSYLRERGLQGLREDIFGQVLPLVIPC